jgi:hypothetical protein
MSDRATEVMVWLEKNPTKENALDVLDEISRGLLCYDSPRRMCQILAVCMRILSQGGQRKGDETK